MNLEKLYRQLTIEEGKSNKLYKCPAGYNTIGIGHNLDAKPISDLAIETIFEDDVDEVIVLLDKYLPWWRDQNEVRQNALIDLGFNLGIGPSEEDENGKLLTFRNTLAAFKRNDFTGAANGLSNSLWYKQVGTRGARIVKMVLTGEWPDDI